MKKEILVKYSLSFVAPIIMWDEPPSNRLTLEGESFEWPTSNHFVEAKTAVNLRVSGSSASSYHRRIRDDQMFCVSMATKLFVNSIRNNVYSTHP